MSIDMRDKKSIKAVLLNTICWSLVLLGAVGIIVISLYWHRSMGQIPEIFEARFSVRQTAFLGGMLWIVGTAAVFVFHYLSDKYTALCTTLIILGAGLFIALFSPVINGFDEQSHLFKTIASLDGKMFNYESYNYAISDSYLDLWNHVLNPWYSSIFNEPWKESTTYVLAADYGFAQPTYPVYGYLFCMLGFGIARLLRLSTGICFVAGRITNLLGYVLLIDLAFLILPQNAGRVKNALTLYAAFPPLLYVAAHYTQDGTVYGLVAILLALFVRMYLSEKASLKEFLWFSVLLILLGPLKYPYMAMGLLLFVIPKERYAFKRPYLKICVLAVVTLLVSAGWYFLISTQFHENRVDGVDGMAQIRFMLSQPFDVIVGAVNTMFVQTAEYFQRFFRLCGGLNYYVATGFSLVLCIANLFMMVLFGSELKLTFGRRLIVFFACFGITAITVFAVYASYNTVGETRYFQGIQGRYFYGLIPVIPMLVPRFRMDSDQAEAGNTHTLPVLVFVLIECCAFMTSMGVLI